MTSFKPLETKKYIVEMLCEKRSTFQIRNKITGKTGKPYISPMRHAALETLQDAIDHSESIFDHLCDQELDEGSRYG